ncbi:hypothetical protein [Rickettsiella grylli]|nr:hypothetical protein [Rickettsiella grylli]
MNNEINVHRGTFFPLNTRPLKIPEPIKKVNPVNKNAVYNLTWNGFYWELRQRGTKHFMRCYGFSSRKKLQLFIARSNLWQEKITLGHFETNTQSELMAYLGDKFFDQVSLEHNFNPKNHKLSTIHYFIYNYNLSFAALSLGFSSLQSFLNFFAKSSFVADYSINKAENLSIAIGVLQKADPIEMKNELGQLYNEPLIENKRFERYNYTLEELKLALETENFSIVIASLGGGSIYAFNKKLKRLSPVINVQLDDLKKKSWEALLQNIPLKWWKVKLDQFFSQKEMFFRERACAQQFFHVQPQNVIAPTGYTAYAPGGIGLSSP